MEKQAEKKLCHSHFGDEGPDFAEGLAEDPGVLLPVDVQVVGQAWNEQKEREWSGEWEGGRGKVVTWVTANEMETRLIVVTGQGRPPTLAWVSLWTPSKVILRRL